MSRDDADPTRKRIPRSLLLDAAVNPFAEDGGDSGSLEAKLLSRGLKARDLRKEAEEADHERGEVFKDHFERMALFTVWGVFVVFMLLGVTWTVHTLIPPWRWLLPQEVGGVQNLLTGGIIAGLIADHVRRRMG